MKSYDAYMMKSQKFIRTTIGFSLLIVAALAGCTTSEPVPVPAPSTFDRSWSAAVSAAQDEGVRITSEDRGSGVIRGVRTDQEVTINLRSQADGSVRIEIGSRGPKGSDPGLANRISRAYDRRMGR
ncbi:MAG TPA: hypothetical protein VFY96_14850 [Candidatus Binatia bacterium]|jgi:hypothetical protein|nr:hypothetical protein [Candidatus Binatia bacterium]